MPSVILVNPLGSANAQRIGLPIRDYIIGETIAVDDFVASTLIRTGYAVPSALGDDEVLIVGDGPPSGSTGLDGQYYLDALDEVLYGPKKNGLWPTDVVRPGRAISQAKINPTGNLTITYDTGETVDLGPVVGEGYGGGFFLDPEDPVNHPLVAQIVSRWGIRDNGTIYYDANGADPAEAGLLVPDPESGGMTIFRPGAPFATALDGKVAALVASSSATRTALDGRYLNEPAVLPTANQVLRFVDGAPKWVTADLEGFAATKSTVEARTSAATASTVVARDSAGRFRAVDGTDPADVATKAQIDTRIATAAIGAASGVAGLDANGKVPQSQLPAIALTEFLGAVSSQAAMLALSGQRGDWATRTDRGTDWQLIAEPSTALASWREMTYPSSPVSSVDGRTGAVTLGTTTATASELVRRTSDGRAKAATATEADDLVPKAQLDTASAATIVTARQEPLARSVTAAITLQAADVADIVLVANSTLASLVQVTIPTNASVAIPIGSWIDVCAPGVGTVLVVGASGVTLRGDGRVYGNYGLSRLLKIGTDEWVVATRVIPKDAYARCFAYMDTNVTGWAAGWNHLPLNAETIDTHNGHNTGAITGSDTDTTSQTNRYTVRPGQAGTYKAGGMASITVGTTSTLHCRILKNNGFIRGGAGQTMSSSISGVVLTGEKMVTLAEGDWLSLQGYCNNANWNSETGETASGGATSWMSVERID